LTSMTNADKPKVGRNKHQVILRPAIESDSPHIRSLIRRVGINPMDLNWRHFTIALSAEGDFVGCAQLKPHRDGSLELASLAVKEAYRSLGVARALIEHLLARSPRPLYLMCRPELQPLYEKFGFKVIGAESMPPYFQRITRLIRIFGGISSHSGPLVMRLD
jgi:N-acetylglutamate synthase-like GNAT family acetyltransferase